MGSRPKTSAPFTVKLDLDTLKETYIYIYMHLVDVIKQIMTQTLVTLNIIY